MVAEYTWEHCGGDSLVWFHRFPGAYVRGGSLTQALAKADAELRSYVHWRDGVIPAVEFDPIPASEHCPDLQVCDADSDALLPEEALAMTVGEYEALKALVLRSASCFQQLYDAVPDKTHLLTGRRETFYGQRPATAEEMYRHTKNVNAYYFDQLGVEACNEPDILACRQEGFSRLEQQPDFLTAGVLEGDYGELWSLRKLCRRFLWHDRIHAKAMYRHGRRVFGELANPFLF